MKATLSLVSVDGIWVLSPRWPEKAPAFVTRLSASLSVFINSSATDLSIHSTWHPVPQWAMVSMIMLFIQVSQSLKNRDTRFHKRWKKLKRTGMDINSNNDWLHNVGCFRFLSCDYPVWFTSSLYHLALKMISLDFICQ